MLLRISRTIYLSVELAFSSFPSLPGPGVSAGGFSLCSEESLSLSQLDVDPVGMDNLYSLCNL